MSKNIYTCEECSQSFKSSQALYAHSRIHNRIMCCSIYSKREISVSDLSRHNKSYLTKLKSCPNCGISHTKPKFCSSSCAAKVNSSGRSRSKESRIKTSKSVKRYIAKYGANRSESMKRDPIPVTWVIYVPCTVCNKMFWSPCRSKKRKSFRKTCSDICHRSICIKNGIRVNNSFKVFCKEINGYVYLDSSWEKKIFDFLEENQIRWLRPKPLKWKTSDGEIKKYYPDFYLLDFDLYLDPKNPYAMEIQKEKMNYINERYNIIYGNLDKIMAGLSELESET